MRKFQVAVFAVLAIIAVSAFAEVRNVVKTVTIASGASTKSETLTLGATEIKEVTVWVPTLDAGDTATLYLKEALVVDASGTTSYVAPRGWSDTSVGATEDNAFKKCELVGNSSSALSIWVDGTAQLTATASTAQEADRVFVFNIKIRHPE